MNRFVALLLFVTLVWGTTFPLLKGLIQALSGVEISALRFLLAAACMLPFAWRLPRHTWRDGALLGAIALVSYVAQAFALEYISSNRSAFLTSLNVLMVPLLGMLWGAAIAPRVLVAAVLACAGIGLMSWEGGANLIGDAATVLCALAYALYVILLSQRSGAHQARGLAAAQIVFMALFSALWLATTGPFQAGPALLERAAPHWGALLYLGVVATAGMLLLQAVGQRHVTADKAAVIFAMEPVFAALWGWFLIDESLGPRAAIGGAVVVLALILSERQPAAASDPAAPADAAPAPASKGEA